MSAGVSDDMRKAKWKAKRACDSAEQLGKQLRRRYQRQQQRQGTASPGRSRSEAELAQELDRLLLEHD